MSGEMHILDKHDVSTGYELVVISDEWGGMPISCRHLLRHFLPSVPLLWVETIGLRSPGVSLYDVKRGLQKVSGWLNPRPARHQDLPANLQILDPPQIPYNHNGVIRRLNLALTTRAILHRCPRNPKRDRVLLTTWPFVGGVVGQIGEKLSIYYRVDDFAEFPGVRKDYIARCEEELIGKVDMVVASSENLADLRTRTRCVRYLPHGVDFELFARASTRSGPPPVMREIPSPRVGFIGLLNSWLDFDLIAEVAVNHPQWAFVLIGPSQLRLGSLPRLPNLHYLGSVPYQELPWASRQF